MLSPVVFQQTQYFPFYLLVSALFYILCSIRREHQVRALLRPKNGYLVWSHGASSARARRVGVGAEYTRGSQSRSHRGSVYDRDQNS